MVIRFISQHVERVRAARRSFLTGGDRLESHPSGLNRTDGRRLSRREVEHRERMLEHLHRMSVAHLPFDRADDAI
jgi:hypothetical protein